MKKLFFLAAMAMALIVSTAACKKSEDEKIQEFIKAKGWTTQLTPEGIHYIIDVEGTGTATPTPSNTITVRYKGYLLNETVFDQNLDQPNPNSWPLKGMIDGWQIGFQKFKKGSKGKLIIPSAYAYGSRGSGQIPANAPLVFEIQLIDFK
jgi:FKBP-type peptidyl-prolyl cis-trans isomerase FkpA